jgi:hypothetical protein
MGASEEAQGRKRGELELGLFFFFSFCGVTLGFRWGGSSMNFRVGYRNITFFEGKLYMTAGPS